MNIFAVNDDPCLAAYDLPDKLVCKMNTEALQMLAPWSYNEHGRFIQKPDGTLYGTKGFAHHPCSKWLYLSPSNVNWLLDHAFALCDEYSRRYNGKEHGTVFGLTQIRSLFLEQYGSQHPSAEHTEFVQAMPDEFKVPGDSVQAYRNYINGYKGYAVWNFSDKPTWWDEAKHEPVRKLYLAEREAKRMKRKHEHSRVQATV